MKELKLATVVVMLSCTQLIITFCALMCLNFKHNAFVCTKLKFHSITVDYTCAIKPGKLRLM